IAQGLKPKKSGGNAHGASAQGNEVAVHGHDPQLFEVEFLFEIRSNFTQKLHSMFWPEEVVALAITAVDACVCVEPVVFDGQVPVHVLAPLWRDVPIRFLHDEGVALGRSVSLDLDRAPLMNAEDLGSDDEDVTL